MGALIFRSNTRGKTKWSGGFELLAALLRPKMPEVMDIACTKIVLAMLGINMDKPA